MTEPEIGTGKTIFVITIVLGCFAVLYPKIFYHMMFEEKKDKPDHLRPTPQHELGRGHPSMHMRNEQGRLFYGEEGRPLRRTIDRELKPGPVPGMRPSMGGPGPGLPPQLPQKGNQGSGGMGMLMPIYTTGIVIFFVYTVMKVMFKKKDEAETDDRPSRRLNAAAAHHQQTLRAAQQRQAEYRPPLSVTIGKQATSSQFEAAEPLTAKLRLPDVQEEVIITPPEVKAKVEVVKVVAEVSTTVNSDPRDDEIKILKERLEETEKAMQMIMSNIATMSNQISGVSQVKPQAAIVTSSSPIDEANKTRKQMKTVQSQESKENSNDESPEEDEDDDEEEDDETCEAAEQITKDGNVETLNASHLVESSSS